MKIIFFLSIGLENANSKSLIKIKVLIKKATTIKKRLKKIILLLLKKKYPTKIALPIKKVTNATFLPKEIQFSTEFKSGIFMN